MRSIALISYQLKTNLSEELLRAWFHFIGFLPVLITALFLFSPFVEKYSLPLLMTIRGERTIPNLVLTRVDESDYERNGIPSDNRFPNAIYEKATNRLLAAGAKAVIVAPYYAHGKQVAAQIATSAASGSTKTPSWLLNDAAESQLEETYLNQMDEWPRFLLSNYSSLTQGLPRQGPNSTLHLDPAGIVNYYGPGNPFPTITLQEVLSNDPLTLKPQLENAVIVIGDWSSSMYSEVPGLGLFPMPVTQATIVANLMDGSAISRTDISVALTYIFLAFWSLCMLIIADKVYFLVPVMSAGLMVLTYVAFAQFNIIIPGAFPALIAGLLIATTRRWWYGARW
jgi:CHASE2 domain-containing sensor protein